jgi:putative endonuclease
MEAVTLIKQRRLRVLASRWLADHPDVRAGALRFDVASVMAKRDAPLQIDVLEGAF